MSSLLLSKKFIAGYFVVSFLSSWLFRFLRASWIEVFLLTFGCFLVGTLSFIDNFIVSLGLKSIS
ncbi:hypothetical protein BBI11_13200 [Planococcus maritimus]|uniref:hypothetical protein n=1 Tax=Planococcus maritimus TaxID=192421 RepID=UPI00080EF803|nr:hypothetical protein [Planococcus maritimus]ANU17931.1 hypothetical protein BBI11_13200 [Planococcus maritimus]